MSVVNIFTAQPVIQSTALVAMHEKRTFHASCVLPPPAHLAEEEG